MGIDDGEGIGPAIRERRRRLGLTLVELAGRSSLSQPFLSQVENGRAAPSMESLARIATALETTPQALFAAPAVAEPRVVRGPASSGAPVLSLGGTSAVRLLLPGDAPFHVLEFDGLPTDFQEVWVHEGFEAVYVLDGAVEIELDGAVSRLDVGDFVSYPAHVPHRHRTVSARPARILMIETALDSGSAAHAAGHAADRTRVRRGRATSRGGA